MWKFFKSKTKTKLKFKNFKTFFHQDFVHNVVNFFYQSFVRGVENIFSI